jgi:hypothetical protein
MTSNTNKAQGRWLAMLALLLASTGAHAQATMTFVSGGGNDSSSLCSETAPCRTFAGALAKTNAGGTITAMDTAAYGTVSISKSITIDGGNGAQAAILAGATTGVLVNGAGINVILRNLRITGGTSSASGINGVRYSNGASLRIENCHISSFHAIQAGNANGVVVDASAAGTYRLYITDSTIVNNGSGDDGGGVRLRQTGGTTFVFADIRNSNISGNNGYGVLTRDRGFVTVSGSNISGNTRSGINVFTSGSLAEAVVYDSTLTDNASSNISSEAGLLANGSASFIHIAGNAINQSETALRRLNGGHINSAGDNRSMGNTTNGTTDGSVTSL